MSFETRNSEYVNRIVAEGKRAKVKKVGRPNVKYTDEQVREIRRAHEVDGLTVREVVAKFDMDLAYAKKLLDYTVRSKVLI